MMSSISELVIAISASDADAERHHVFNTEQKIRSFKQLTAGWCYGSGAPFADDVLDAAISLNACAFSAGLIETDAFPGPEGEVRVTVYHRSDYLEFTVRPGGLIDYVREKDGQEIAEQLALDLNRAQVLIQDFSSEIYGREALTLGDTWILSVSSAGFGTTNIRNDSRTSPLNRPQTDREFQSLMSAA